MGVVPLTGWDGDGVSGVEEEFLIAEAVLQAALEEVQDFIAVWVAVARVGLVRRDDYMPQGHRGGISHLTGSQPGEFAPGLVDQNAFGEGADGGVCHDAGDDPPEEGFGD